MFDKPTLEIPPQMREMAEKQAAQTREAMGQFIAMAKQAQDVMMKLQGETMAPFDSRPAFVQAKAIRYAEQNIDAGLRLATELAGAHDVQEYAEIQIRYAQTQALTLNQQAQTLARLVTQAAQSAQSGTI